MRNFLITIYVLLLSACYSFLPLPETAEIPWQLQHISTTGCPDLTGVYEAKFYYFHHDFMTSRSVDDKSLDIGKISFFEIKNHSGGINIRYWNDKQEKSVFTKIDGLELGCADNKFIKRTFENRYAGGESRGLHSIYYYENIVTKLDNGDLNISSRSSQMYRTYSGLEFDKPIIQNFTVKRVKP